MFSQKALTTFTTLRMSFSPGCARAPLRTKATPPAREVLENRGTGFVVEVGTLGSDIPHIGVGDHGVGVRNGADSVSVPRR